MTSRACATATLCAGLLIAPPALLAQSPSSPSSTSSSRPFGRVSFYSNAANAQVEGLPDRGFGEFTTSLTFKTPDREENGFEYGIDLRHRGYQAVARPQRVSIYEGFVGARMSGGTVSARLGHLWLTDLGALGSVAGGLVELRQAAGSATRAGRLRAGAFGGLEPQVYEARYVPGVRKFGGYVALDGDHARRHVLGFVDVRHASLTERPCSRPRTSCRSAGRSSCIRPPSTTSGGRLAKGDRASRTCSPTRVSRRPAASTSRLPTTADARWTRAAWPTRC
jgi:hypothetical protein